MVQVIKTATRDSIIAAARELVREHGYSGTTLRQITSAADVSLANFYSYFDSKLDLVLFAIGEPWLRGHFERMERDIRKIKNPHQKLRFIVATLWRDIPSEDNCFANNLMQALSTAPQSEYNPRTIEWCKQRLSTMLRTCLPASRRALLSNDSCVHFLFMAFDGFSLNRRLNPNSACTDQIIDLVCALLEGAPLPPSRRTASQQQGNNRVAMKRSNAVIERERFGAKDDRPARDDRGARSVRRVRALRRKHARIENAG
jgi:AcrR family transcriptional regulator